MLENDGEMAEAMNAGLAAADTEFVLPFGSDDIAVPGMVERLLEMSFSTDVVYPAMRMMDEQMREIVGYHRADPFCPYRLLDWNYVSGASLVRRSKALEAGGWRDLRSWEDWDLFVRILRAGGRFKPCPEAELLYRQVPGSRNKLTNDEQHELRRRILGDDADRPMRATFYTGATPATAYVRCQLPALHLPAVVRQGPPALALNEDEDVAVVGQKGRGAILQFPADAVSAIASQHLREQGHRLLVEVDDNYLINPGGKILERSGWAMKIGEESAFTRQGHRWIVRHADGVIVTKPWLAARYEKVNRNVYVCPNGVEPADWPEPPERTDDTIRIAWAA